MSHQYFLTFSIYSTFPKLPCLKHLPRFLRFSTFFNISKNIDNIFITSYDIIFRNIFKNIFKHFQEQHFVSPPRQVNQNHKKTKTQNKIKPYPETFHKTNHDTSGPPLILISFSHPGTHGWAGLRETLLADWPSVPPPGTGLAGLCVWAWVGVGLGVPWVYKGDTPALPSVPVNGQARWTSLPLPAAEKGRRNGY